MRLGSVERRVHLMVHLTFFVAYLTKNRVHTRHDNLVNPFPVLIYLKIGSIIHFLLYIQIKTENPGLGLTVP